MTINRIDIENRILKILTYLDKSTLAFPIKQNIKLFSTKELELLLEFLESGNYEYIYILIDSKYKEYLGIIQELKHLKAKKKLNKYKQEEAEEKNQEEQKLNSLINF